MAIVASRQYSPTLRGAQERPTLLRQIGVISATALVVSNMVGTGIFTSTGFLAGDLGSAGLILLIWVVGAIAALCGAFCYSELGVNFPSSGGEYVYLTQAYGPTWGFMTGWISFFAGFSAPIAAAALAFSDYLGYFFPGVKQANAQYVIGSGEWAWKIGGAQIVACSLVGIFTILNFFGVQRVARVQILLTGFKIAILVIFIICGFAFGAGNWGNFAAPATRSSTAPIAAQFAVSLFWIYVAYSGWNAATYVAEEIKQPARTLPLGLAVGTGFVAVLFIVLNVVFIYGVPLEEMKGVVAIGSLAASRLFGPEGASLFSALMALGLLSTVNAMVTVGPRVYYAMAKNAAFFASAARVHPHWRTPVIAIVAQGICTMLMTLAPFRDLIVYIGFLLNFFAVMSVASIFIFRRRAGWQKLRVVSFAYPLIPVVFVLIGSWMTYQGLRGAFAGDNYAQRWTIIAAVATVGAGALVYHLRIGKQRV
jgi:APA family basic amino acid/polyamine antiporter